jgi:PKD repeat protein
VPLAAPAIRIGQQAVSAGQSVKLGGTSTDAPAMTLSYQWNFGDGATAQGADVTHAYAAPGQYVVSLVARDASGRSATTTSDINVLASTNDRFVPDCAGPGCAARDAGTFSGSGVGTWRYTNSTATDATLMIDVAGVAPGQQATQVYSRAGSAAAAIAPAAARTAKVGGLFLPAPTFEDPHDHHGALLEHNIALSKALQEGAQAAKDASSAAGTAQRQARAKSVTAAQRTSTSGDTRNWWVTEERPSSAGTTPATAVQYDTTAQAQCSVPASGRRVVFWLDPRATQAGVVTSDDIAAMVRVACGAGAGLDQMAHMLGDVWGLAAGKYAGQLIEDTAAAPLDINIVIPYAPSDTPWGGYFNGINNFVHGASGGIDASDSNEALAIFLNARSIQANRDYMLSALLHEATHLTNFYQRTVARGTTHEAWLEETSAMMTEDVIATALIPGYQSLTTVQIPQYLRSGGGVDYVRWQDKYSRNYALGGAFGAYLNRRYGPVIYRQLVDHCDDGAPGQSYQCLDTLIAANGGLGFADEFAHFGAAMFAALPASGAPAKYGYAARNADGYSLGTVDISAFLNDVPSSAAIIDGQLAPTSHAYVREVVSGNRYQRRVTVPAGVTLLLVIGK